MGPVVNSKLNATWRLRGQLFPVIKSQAKQCTAAAGQNVGLSCTGQGARKGTEPATGERDGAMPPPAFHIKLLIFNRKQTFCGDAMMGLSPDRVIAFATLLRCNPRARGEGCCANGPARKARTPARLH